MTFRLSAGADENAFLESNHRLQAFMSGHDGFMRRTVARSADGEWVAVVLWDSLAAAEASQRRWDTDPVMQDFLRGVESLDVKRYEDLGG